MTFGAEVLWTHTMPSSEGEPLACRYIDSSSLTTNPPATNSTQRWNHSPPKSKQPTPSNEPRPTTREPRPRHRARRPRKEAYGLSESLPEMRPDIPNAGPQDAVLSYV